MLLDENLRTQLLLLSQLPILAYTPVKHRRLTSVGFAANNSQTDCWHFCSHQAEGPHVGIQQRLLLSRRTQILGVVIESEQNLPAIYFVHFFPRFTKIKQTNKKTQLRQISAILSFCLDLFQSIIVQTLPTHNPMTTKNTELILFS